MSKRKPRRGGGLNAAHTRTLKQRVKTARGRKSSSTQWLQRQLNDPYVAAARRDGYRSRAAYKLAEIDDKFHILKPGARVVDLGAAPGGWTQIAVERTARADGGSPMAGSSPVAGSSHVVGIDLLPVDPIPGATCVQLDFRDETAPAALKTMLDGPADVVLSDMAASATGHKPTDHLRIMALCELALDFALDVLKPGGSFLAKVLQGGAERELMATLKRAFHQVRHVKPKASRSDSAEMYVLATGFKGTAVHKEAKP